MEKLRTILETVPLPCFVARYSGTIVFGNPALAESSGQPDPVAPDRTLFGLGIFNDTADLRSFLQGFSFGEDSRRLVLTTGRYGASTRPVTLYGTLIDWEGEPALCGITSRTMTRAKVGRDNHYPIVSKSDNYAKVLQQIEQVARTDSTVLITGETGTGKELIARAVHAQSCRAGRQMVVLNCGALSAELIESELFGYRKGAFTGADSDYIGRFELADKSTLFLDEIGEMPLLLQTRLLRFLQEGEFVPLGARSTMTADVRVIAATNHDLKARVNAGEFRADLFYRLNVFPIHSIPLKDRTEDIPLLVDHFIRKYSSADEKHLPKVPPPDLERLQNHPFEGNVRELENIIQRGIILSKGKTLPIVLDQRAPNQEAITPLRDGGPEPFELLTFEEMQRRYITRILKIAGGKVSGQGGAAELLGLRPQTLFSKMRKLGIQRK